MRVEEFHRWLSRAAELTPSQEEQVLSWFTRRREEQQVARTLNDRRHDCPHCDHGEVIHWGNAHGLPRYRCKACHKTFNVLSGTPLARLRHRKQWIAYAQALVDGLSVRKAAAYCEVHKNTAFRWRHRFLTTIAAAEPTCLQGIVEADETYFLESFKGQRKLPRPARKRGGKASKRGLSEEQIPVLIARDRHQVTLDSMLGRATTQAIHRVLGPVLSPDVVLCSDANPIYQAFTRQAHIEHRCLNLSAGIRVQDHAYHIQNVNAYDSRLKGWMMRFRGVATKYLPNYLGWRRCLEKFRGKMTPQIMLQQALG